MLNIGCVLSLTL